MLFGSPSGIALSTQKSAHVSADQHVNFVSGQNTHIATGKSLIVGVAEKLSLFVQNAGMKLFAAKGKVEIQAHSDNIELTAQKTLTLLSATEKIEAAAKQEILLTSGGAYIRMKGGDIEIHAPGMVDIKGSQHSFNGPVRKNYPLPNWPQPETQGPVKFNMLLADTPGPDGYPHINTAWRMVSAPTADEALMSSDSILTGQSDTSGKLALSDADEKTLHEAYNKTPGQVWLVYAGQVRSLSLSRESGSWSESDKFYEAIDAMGYSDQPFSAQQTDVDQSFAQWARQELKVNDGDAVLGKLKGDA